MEIEGGRGWEIVDTSEPRTNKQRDMPCPSGKCTWLVSATGVWSLALMGVYCRASVEKLACHV